MQGVLGLNVRGIIRIVFAEAPPDVGFLFF